MRRAATHPRRPRHTRHDEPFAALVISPSIARLFQCDGEEMTEVIDHRFPVTSTPEPHTATRHETDREAALLSYLWRIQAALDATIGHDDIVVLAGRPATVQAFEHLVGDPRIEAVLDGDHTRTPPTAITHLGRGALRATR